MQYAAKLLIFKIFFPPFLLKIRNLRIKYDFIMYHKHITLFLFLFGIFYAAFSQNDSTPNARKLILGKLPAFQSMEIDPEGNILLLLSEKAKIYKYFAANQYDSCIIIGGKPSREEGFLHPTKISAKNRQTVFVLDEGTRKIALLNTNFKITESIDFAQTLFDTHESGILETEILPLSFDVSASIDMFILNGLDNKVYKLNRFGKMELSFGGQDYGEGNLREPMNVEVSNDNDVFVGDAVNQEISVFNLYGVFQYKCNKINFQWKNFGIYEGFLYFYGLHEWAVMDIKTSKIFYFPKIKENIVDLAIENNSIYILLENQIILYPIDYQ